MKLSRKGMGGVALAVVLCLVATGCGGSAKQKAKKEAIAATAVDINEKPRDQVQDGGTLTLPLSEMPPNFNVHQADGGLGDTQDVVGSMLPDPFETDAKAQFSVNKDYYDSVELTSTDPKQVVTYRINPKAVWLDGSPITWKDLEAQWKALRGTDPAYEVVSSQGYDKIESVIRGKDDREVIVTYGTKFADWQGPFDNLVPAALNSDVNTFNKGWTEKPLTSAGPFKFDSIDKTNQTITLVRNEKWWGDKAKLDKIIFRVIDIKAQLDSLANGEIDQVDVGPDVNAYARAKTLPGIDLRKAGGPDYRHVTINGQSELMSDIKVRKAFALATDRDAIAKALLAGVELPPAPQNNHIYMANQEGYKDNAGKFGKQDIAAANKLLDEAGWKLEGSGDNAIRKKDGKELKVRFVIPAGVPQAEQESNLLRQQVAPTGIVLDVLAAPSGDFFEKYIYPGNYDICVFRWAGAVFPISAAKSIFQNPIKKPDGELDIRQNFARIGSPELDGLFDKATQVFDKQEAIDLGNQIDTMIWEEVHSLPLYQRPQIFAVRSNIANLGASGFQSTPGIQDVGFVKGSTGKK